MKRKVLVSLMLSMVLTFGMTACGGEKVEESAISQKEQVQESKQEQSENLTPEEEEEVKVDLTGNYKWVDTDTVDEYDYAENVLTFVGNNEVIKIKGYYCDSIINGTAIASTGYGADMPQGIISKDGQELVPMGKYDSLVRAGFYNNVDCVVARDVATQKFGIITVLGEEVVPFEYDELQFYDYFYRAKKGEMYDFYSAGGNLMLGDMSTDKYSLIQLDADEQGKRLIQFIFYELNEIYYLAESKDDFLERPDDYASDMTHKGDHFFRYIDKEGKYKYIRYSEDWKSIEPVSISGDNYVIWGDKLFVGSALYDKDYNLLQKATTSMKAVLHHDGEITYVSGNSICNEKFENIITVPEVKKFYPVGGLIYGNVKDATEESFNKLFDADGNLLYENIDLLTYTDNEKEIQFLTQDGIYGYKTIYMPELVTSVEGETLLSPNANRGYLCFTNEAGQYIFRDKELNHIATFDGRTEYYPDIELFCYQGEYYQGDYYNKQGELIYSSK